MTYVDLHVLDVDLPSSGYEYHTFHAWSVHVARQPASLASSSRRGKLLVDYVADRSSPRKTWWEEPTNAGLHTLQRSFGALRPRRPCSAAVIFARDRSLLFALSIVSQNLVHWHKREKEIFFSSFDSIVFSALPLAQYPVCNRRPSCRRLLCSDPSTLRNVLAIHLVSGK